MCGVWGVGGGGDLRQPHLKDKFSHKSHNKQSTQTHYWNNLVLSILMNFDQSQNSNQSTPLGRPSQKLLNACFSFKIRQSKHKL